MKECSLVFQLKLIVDEIYYSIKWKPSNRLYCLICCSSYICSLIFYGKPIQQKNQYETRFYLIEKQNIRKVNRACLWILFYCRWEKNFLWKIHIACKERFTFFDVLSVLLDSHHEKFGQSTDVNELTDVKISDSVHSLNSSISSSSLIVRVNIVDVFLKH